MPCRSGRSSPSSATAATRFVHAAYNKSILPTRVREAARMRIAQLNDCTVCLAFRADTVKAQGLDEDFYCAVGSPDDGPLTEQERLAVEYAERFAIDHTSIDDRVHGAAAGLVHRSRDPRPDHLPLGLPRSRADAAARWASRRRR